MFLVELVLSDSGHVGSRALALNLLKSIRDHFAPASYGLSIPHKYT